VSADIRYTLTAHATRVITEREILLEWVARVLEWVARVLDEPTRVEPDRHHPALRHALASIPEYDGRVLRVVYNETTKPWQVVTAYFDRKQRGRI
jgi:Domain of unknown function (DUF4258)